jgi:hypothetical protein
LGILRKHFEELNKTGYKTITVQQIDMGLITFESMDKDYIIHRFIKFTHENWDKIYERDPDFFINNSSQVFGAMSKERFNMLNELFTLKNAKGESIITDQLKTIVMDFFITMVKTSIKYVHKKRLPYHYNGQNFYETEFSLYPSLCPVDKQTNLPIPTTLPIALAHHIAKWNIKVDFPSIESDLII